MLEVEQDYLEAIGAIGPRVVDPIEVDEVRAVEPRRGVRASGGPRSGLTATVTGAFRSTTRGMTSLLVRSGMRLVPRECASTD